MMKIFVSNFGWGTTIAHIAELFLKHGDVSSIRIRHGQKRVYAIVEMPDESDAAEAIRELDGTDYEGQRLEVAESTW